MTNDKNFDDDAPKNGEYDGADSAEGDSGLGNLPPLSEFDSHGGFDSDGDLLPPLGDFESQDSSLLGGGGTKSPSSSGLPFSSDFSTGVGKSSLDGRPADKPDFGLVSNGFQDLAADSDFSPETPDIGPGPDSTLDTPIFDSAFGPGDSSFNVDQTSTATQAMESPMFDDFGGDIEFGSPTGATPVPDFSPDTGFGDLAGIGAPVPVGANVGGSSGGMGAAISAQTPRKGLSAVWIIVVGLISLGVGLLASQPLSSYLSFVPGNPLAVELQNRDTQIAGLNRQLDTLRQLQATPEQPADISPERLAELQNEILLRTQELDTVKGQLDSQQTALNGLREQLTSTERDLRERTDEVVAAREFLEELRNETAIVQARQRGLIAEVDRLTSYVGELDEANARRIATKEALQHSVDRLLIQVKESIPLTPEKYDYQKRLAAVESLGEKVAQSLWVSPEIQNEYTTLHLRETELARANEYFFARIPVTDRFGHKAQTWAECLMQGNRAVFYRTLDGKNIGSYENAGTSETPNWKFKEDLNDVVKQSIESQIVSARVPDFEGQAQRIAERELAGREGTSWQLIYNSL